MLKIKKINFITYANHNFAKSKNRLLEEAKNFETFHKIEAFEPKDLDDQFVKNFKFILEQKRIAGYGIWRPYIIKNFLLKTKTDYLIYADAGCTININAKKRFYEYLELLDCSKYGIISMRLIGKSKKGVPHTERLWTTKEIFNYFNVPLNSDIALSDQYLDTVLIMKNNDHLHKTIDIWLKCVYENPLMFTDAFNKHQEPYFKDNRHEQSVLSIIRKLNGSCVINNELNFEFFGCKESLLYPFWATRYRY